MERQYSKPNQAYNDPDQKENFQKVLSHLTSSFVSMVIPHGVEGQKGYNMNNFIRGITYSYNRNIGWQDRAIRTLVGIGATIGAVYFLKTNVAYAILLGILAIAQFGTIFSARCIICYFAGKCTIDSQERKSLEAKGIHYETQKN